MNNREIDSLKLLLVALSNFDDKDKWINLTKKQLSSVFALQTLEVIKSWNVEDVKECSNDMLDQLSKITDQKSQDEFISFWN